MIYLTDTEGTRVLLDTSKAKLNYEGRQLDLTGGRLAVYEARWGVADGTWTREVEGVATEIAAKVLMVTDPFTGLQLEVPLALDAAKQVAAKLDERSRWYLPVAVACAAAGLLLIVAAILLVTILGG